MAVITVSRQLGSGGDRIAEAVAEELGFELVDQRLVEEIAQITDTSVQEVEKYDEKGEGRVRHFLKRLLVPEMSPGGFPLSSAAYFPEFGLEFPYVMQRGGGEQQAAYLDRGTYQLLITTLVRDFGDTGSAVVVGRASQVILGQHPQAFHVKIISPIEDRVRSVQERQEVTADQARELIEQHDRWRQLYLKNHHDADWNDLLLYHVTINTGRMNSDAAVETIVHHIRESG